jgi:geranylgeranyl diphosphate synthase type I
VEIVLAAGAAANGDPAVAAHIATGVELFMASLDLLDEVEDDDFSPTVEAVGIPQALNVATALLLLGQQALLALPVRDDLLAPASFVQVLTSAGLTATRGQHRDLALEGASAATTDDALAIARLKAGALGGAACRLGAMSGTADASLLDLYARWGAHYGTAVQLANDLHDALDGERKTDLERRKSTLPLIFSHHAGADTADQADLAASGALHFTWVVVEIERQACREVLAQLAERGQNVAPLRDFVPSQPVGEGQPGMVGR